MTRLCALLAVVTLLAACASGPANPTASGTSTASASAASAKFSLPPRPIDISPEVGLVFRPTTDVPAAALSPREAWARYIRHMHHKKTRIPAGVRVQYGSLSCATCNLINTHSRFPCPGRGAFDWSCIHVRSYGYSLANTGCLNSNPNYSPPPHLQCTEWTFLNAFTGHMILGAWQQTNPRP